MPELPEMETYCRTITAHILHHAFTGISAARPRRLNVPVDSARRLLVGSRVAEIERAGKMLALHLDAVRDGISVLAVHLMVGGRISWHDHSKEDAVCLHFDNGTLAFHLGLGQMQALTASAWVQTARRIGLNPLSPAYRREIWASHYGHSRKPIKACLLDQSVVSGIGNVYSDEICYHAQIHPATPAHRLLPEDWGRIGDWVPRVLNAAVAAGGVGPPLEPGDLHSGGYRCQLQVHYREGEPCGGHGLVVSGRVAGRTAYWCPAVQPAPQPVHA